MKSDRMAGALLLALVLIALPVVAAANQEEAAPVQAAVSGKVTNTDGEPVEAALVMAVNTRTGNAVDTGTDENGEYALEGLANGRYEISVACDGYEPYVSDQIQVNVAGPVRHDVKLVPEPAPQNP
jgi:hypothetical protein